MDAIGILDFGGQYTQLIARRIRDSGVYAEILPSDTPHHKLGEYNGLVLSGGSQSVNDAGAPSYDARLFDLDIPILGICYGMQLMNYESGGRVEHATGEYGHTPINITAPSQLFGTLDQRQNVWMSHGDSVVSLGPDYQVLARTADGVIAAIANPARHHYGVQFHPEVTHTENGDRMLDHFVSTICEASHDWDQGNMVDRATRYIQDTVGDRHVLLLVSGGVDSTVCAGLLAHSLDPDQLTALHIDNGLMRKNESLMVGNALRDAGVRNLRVADYTAAFLDPLRDVVDPETKRRIIGDTFATVAEAEIAALGLGSSTLLAQGTIYPDRVESGGGVGSQAARIKLHHNRSPAILEMMADGRIVEPNRDLFKDEVRKVGEGLGLPEDLVWRHPFPGPGLGIRIICSDNTYLPDGWDETADIVDLAAAEYDLGGTVFPIRTVGVQGDARTYEPLAVLRGDPDWDALRSASERITKQTRRINRVAYLDGMDLDNHLPTLSPLTITRDSLTLLREADAIANDVLERYDLRRVVSQMPVVLFPGPDCPYIGVRDVVTDDFMTARPSRKPEEFPWEAVHAMTEEIRNSSVIQQLGGVAGVVYDITDKPPGTIEWE